MRKYFFILAALLCGATATAQSDNAQQHVTSDYSYGFYAGVGYMSPVGDLADYFKGNAAFHIGITGAYDRFRLKADVQYGQPSYKSDNIFNAPVVMHNGKEYPSQVNDNSSASYTTFGIQVGYTVAQVGRVLITPNVGVNFGGYSWNLRNIEWKENEAGEYVVNKKTVEKAKFGVTGAVASVDFDYQLGAKITSGAAFGESQKRFTSYIRVSPFVSYCKVNPTPSHSIENGCVVGVAVSYVGLFQSLGL